MKDLPILITRWKHEHLLKHLLFIRKEKSLIKAQKFLKINVN